GQDILVEEGDSIQISSTGFGATDEDDTGDPSVDDGLTQSNGNGNNKGNPEQRRGAERPEHTRPSSSNRSSSNSNGNSNGGTTGGSTSGGGTTGGSTSGGGT